MRLEELWKQNEANIQEIYKTRERILNEVNQSITDKKKQLELVDANLQATNRQLRIAQENLNNYKNSMQATIDE
jgi:exonuclease VII large subunit